MKQKTVAIIEARFGSTRLPGKVMKRILGKPMLKLMIERVKKADLLDDIIIATTIRSRDDVIEKLARNVEVKCFRGSEDDVLDRVYQAAKKYKIKHIVELWGDTPLIDPAIINRSIRYYFKNNYDCLGTTINKKSYSIGMSLLIFSIKILKEVNYITKKPIYREHVSNYIYSNPDKYKIGSLPCPDELKRPELRLVVDEPADFKLIKIIFENLYNKKKIFSYTDIIRFIDKNPHYKKINQRVKQRQV